MHCIYGVPRYLFLMHYIYGVPRYVYDSMILGGGEHNYVGRHRDLIFDNYGGPRDNLFRQLKRGRLHRWWHADGIIW